MRLFKRIFFFLVLNCIVVLTVSAVLSGLNIKPYLNAYGLDIRSLMIFCLTWGMVGSLISLALSKKMAKYFMGVKIIPLTTTDPSSAKMIELVNRLSKDAGLKNIPEVGIFLSKDLNAFATGPTKKRSLIAVSSRLLEEMNLGELEAILAHEISHIASGDMVTMTLIQGIVNAFVMFLARVLAFALSSIVKGESRHKRSYGNFYILSFIFEIIFMIIGSMVIATFSRFREYQADQGGAILAGKDKMISALEKLGANKKFFAAKKPSLKAMHALMISTPPKIGLLQLFSTHPPISKRIAKLKELP